MTGKTHTIGTRAQVWHGTAKKTSGGLTKSDLMMNKAGRIVSKSKHFTAKKEMRLLKHGYGTKKGQFGFVKIVSRRRHRKGSKKMRGGMAPLSPLDLSEGIAGAGITDYSQQGSVGLQLEAGQAGGRRRKLRGGSGMSPLSPAGSANWAGDGIAGAGVTDYSQQGSVGLQLQAGQAGGRKKMRKMRGGTGFAPALAASGSTDVQLQAGLGN